MQLNFREPKNEPFFYAPVSEERRLLQEELEKQANMQVEFLDYCGKRNQEQAIQPK